MTLRGRELRLLLGVAVRVSATATAQQLRINGAPTHTHSSNSSSTIGLSNTSEPIARVPVPSETAESHSVAMSLQVTMLFVVFVLLLCVGVCCSLHAVCRKYKCCASVYGARDSSFDALVSRAGSCYREDLLNDDELQRLWICWYCDFANYEMKLQCALCGHDKKQRDFSHSPGRKPSAVRPASLLAVSSSSYAATYSSSSSPSSASASPPSSGSSAPNTHALTASTVLLANGLSPSELSTAASEALYFNPSFLVHAPLDPLPESPSISGVAVSTPPGSPRRSLLSAASLLSMPLMAEADNARNSMNLAPSPPPSHRQAAGSFSSSRVRRREWRVRLSGDNHYVWSRNADLFTAAGACASSYASASPSDYSLLQAVSVLSPSSIASSSPSSARATESIVHATAFVSRVLPTNAHSPAPAETSTASKFSLSKLQLEPAEHARVYAALEAVHTDVNSLSCGVDPHAVESVRGLSFPEKHRWFMQETSSLLHVRWGSPELARDLTLTISRDDLLATTVHSLMRASQTQLHRPLRVQFANEPGVDAGGIVREWFSLALDAFLDPTTGLFQCVHTSEDGLAYTINPNASLAVDAHLIHLRALGRLLGKALLEGHLVAAPLTDVLFKHILSAPVSFADLEAVDRKLAHSLQLLWTTPLTDSDPAQEDDDDDPYALDFSVYHTARGIVDLVPNGRNVTVTERNKREYVTQFVQWHLAHSVADEVSAIVRGVYDVVPIHLLAPFDYTELRLLLCGSPTIDVDDWEAHAVVAGRHSRAVSRLTTWFWRALRRLSPTDQGRVLQFATGSARVPIQGFRALTASDGRLCPFTIHCFATTECPFLRAFTCFNRLDLPLYKTEQELQDALTLLLQTDVTGFSVQ